MFVALTVKIKKIDLLPFSDAVRKMPRHSSAQNSDMEEFIKVWLKNTKQRMQKMLVSGQD